MRAWKGLRDDQTEVGGDGLSDATGVSFAVEGELRRRTGLSYLAASGGKSLATFRSPVTGSWILAATAAGAVNGIKLSDASVTSLATGYNVEKPWNWAAINGRLYLTNDFDRVKVWDGLASALRDAGMAAPSGTMGGPDSTAAGNCTAGTHLLRYRFVDSTSPGGTYRSNPSGTLSHAVTSGQGALTFTIGTSGTDIIRSTDPKADTIVIEMTLAGGSDYFVATTCANSATSVTVSISDTNLALQDPATLYDETGHEQPPIGSVLFEARGYAFLCGFIPRTRTVAVENGSDSVAGTDFSTLWIGRMIRFGTDSRAYEIASATATAITLTEDYAGSDNASVSATIYSKSPSRAYYSKAYFPESYKALARARDILLGTGDRLVGGVDYAGDAWFFGQRSMCRLVFTEDPADGEVVPVPGYHGLWNQACLVSAEGMLFGWGPNGLWRVSGGRPQWMSRPIETTLAGLVDLTQMDLAHGQYNPADKVVRWHFVGSGDSACKYALSYDLAGQRWTIDRYRQGIDAGVTYADDNARLRLAVSDATNGRLWYHEGATDGVPSSSTGSYTATTGSTTTVTQVTDSLPTGTGTDLAGVMLYRPSTGEAVAITSNTTGAITHAAFATAVASGEALYAGAIPWSVTLDWWTGKDLATKKRPHLHVHVNPSSTGSIELRLYRDFSASPYTWTANSDDRWQDSVTLTNNGTYLTLNLNTGTVTSDGFISVPMPAEWARSWRVRLDCVSPAGTLKLLDVRLVDEGRDERPETRE